MFTGIVEEVGEVAETPGTGLRIRARTVLEDAHLGDSIAINGTCLTVTAIDEGGFCVDTVPVTLRRTNLGELRPGDPVNLERALPAGGRMGGHFVQGHIEGTGRIAAIDPEREALLIRIEAPPEVMRYVVEKGFITVDGISLTVVSCDDNGFVITIIPFTQAHTNLRVRRTGDTVNLETDILAKYVEQFTNRAGEAPSNT
ncbi:MAG: riboflavin synthase [Dehalococcoidia bacterium]